MKEVSHQVIAVLTVSLAFVSFGNILCFPSALYSSSDRYGKTIYGERIHLTEAQNDLVGSLVGVGAILGVVMLPFLKKVCGKRKILITMGFSALASWIGVALSPGTTGILVFRFLSGVYLGIVSVVGVNYHVEVEDRKIRGILCCFVLFSTVVGQTYSAILNYWFQYFNVALLNCVFPALFLLGILIIPENSKYLVLRVDAVNRSEIIFSSLSPPHSDMEVTDEENLWYEWKQPKTTKRLAIIVALLFLRGFGGLEILIANSYQIFKSLDVEENLATIMLYLAQLVGTMIFFVIWSKVGRRKCLFISVSIATSFLICLAANSFLDDENIDGYKTKGNESNYEILDATGWSHGNNSFKSILKYSSGLAVSGSSFWSYFPMLSVFLCISGFSIGLQGIPFIIITEQFPSWNGPSQIAAICISCYALFQFVSLQLFSPLVTLLTLSGYYLLIALTLFSGIPLTYFFIENVTEQ